MCWIATCLAVWATGQDGWMWMRDRSVSSTRTCRRVAMAPMFHCGSVARVCATSQDAKEWTWRGEDEFTSLGDRQSLPPRPLPTLSTPRRVVLVRHGQSTWNAEGRIQGCSDFAKLTKKGKEQAQTSAEMLREDRFDALFCSPLQRASETADIIWRDREQPKHVLPSLREVDLYSFQGLLKEDGKAKFGDEFVKWQKDAVNFSIDDHYPVRELWYRASLAWQDVLDESRDYRSCLVVAHNAVNQALLATALGLDPIYFRRMLQSNAAISVLDFVGNNNVDGNIGGTKVTLDRLNQSPDPPFAGSGAGRKARARLVFVRHGGTDRSEDGLIAGKEDERCNLLGRLHAVKTAEFLLDLEIDTVLSSPLYRAVETAREIALLQPLGGHKTPPILEYEELAELDFGDWAGRPMAAVRGQEWPEDGETLEDFWQRTKIAWHETLKLLDKGEGKNILVVGHGATHAAFVCHCLGLGPQAISLFRIETGGVTIMDFPDGALKGKGVLRSINYHSHLGRWSVPATQEDYTDVCGIDGCF